MMSTENSIYESASISWLNDSNYAEWTIRMEAILIWHKLWSAMEIIVDMKGKTQQKIDEEITKKKATCAKDKMAWAQAEMILQVNDNQLVHMIVHDPMEIWQTLQHVHQAAGFATSLLLHQWFPTAKKSDLQTMQAWIGEIQDLAFWMENADIVVTD